MNLILEKNGVTASYFFCPIVNDEISDILKLLFLLFINNLKGVKNVYNYKFTNRTKKIALVEVPDYENGINITNDFITTEGNDYLHKDYYVTETGYVSIEGKLTDNCQIGFLINKGNNWSSRWTYGNFNYGMCYLVEKGCTVRAYFKPTKPTNFSATFYPCK